MKKRAAQFDRQGLSPAERPARSSKFTVRADFPSMYAAIDDPYCYPGTTVLKNKLGLRSQRELDAFESEMSFERSTDSLPSGRLSYSHYRAIHRHLFQDVYAWAGKVRTVRICWQRHIQLD